MKQKTPGELKAMLDSGDPVHLIDVREAHEYESGNLGGTLMPLGEILDRADDIPRDKPVVLYCRSGARSGAALQQLEARFGFDNLYNLEGGIMAYASQFDPSLIKF